jgi:hypothetical protein
MKIVFPPQARDDLREILLHSAGDKTGAARALL